MNTDERIEHLLADAHLAQPSGALDERVLEALDGPAAYRLYLGRAISAAAIVAVIGLALLVVGVFDTPTADDGIVFIDDEALVEATIDTTELVDDGVVRVSETGLPVRQVRRVTTRQFLYFNRDTNETMEITVPQEDVIHMVNEPF